VFAKVLGGRLHCIHYLRSHSRLNAPIRYGLQAIRTLQVLFTGRAQMIHVQNPPFICGLTVYLFCCVTGAHFIFDHHSAAFARDWRWAIPIQRFLARRAVTNIVTNQHWADIVQSWGARALIMGDPFLPLPQGEAFPVKQGFTIVLVGGFAPDTPLETVLQAAAQLPDVHFYITGDPRRTPTGFFETLPTNVTCTGFLPDAQYIGLLRAADAIMVLTRRNHTLQLGGCEAVSVGQPLITSDWPFLRDFFSMGTVYVADTATSIRDGVLMMQKERRRLKEEIVALRDSKKHEWNTQLAQLNELADQALCGDREFGPRKENKPQ
jgi:glycosyltransferase involved in cell wall biosynthesis